MAETGGRSRGWVPWRGGQVGAGILLVALSVLVVSAMVIPLGNLAGKYDRAVAAWTASHLLGLLIFAVVWYLGPKRYRVPLSSLGLTPPRPPRFRSVLMVVGTLAASLGTTALYAWLVGLLDSHRLSPPNIPQDIAFPGLASGLTFEALAIWTPLSEEVFFRGFVFAGMVPRLGVARSMIASALVFSIFHISLETLGVLVPIFITGLLLAGLYYRTGSLWSSIAAHAGQNAVALAVTISSSRG